MFAERNLIPLYPQQKLICDAQAKRLIFRAEISDEDYLAHQRDLLRQTDTRIGARELHEVSSADLADSNWSDLPYEALESVDITRNQLRKILGKNALDKIATAEIRRKLEIKEINRLRGRTRRSIKTLGITKVPATVDQKTIDTALARTMHRIRHLGPAVRLTPDEEQYRTDYQKTINELAAWRNYDSGFLSDTYGQNLNRLNRVDPNLPTWLS